MKTLDEYNKERAEVERARRANAHKAHVACNKCGAEMHYSEPGVCLASNPPKYAVHCPTCGERGYKR